MPHKRSYGSKRRREEKRVRAGCMQEEGPVEKKPRRCSEGEIQQIRYLRCLRSPEGKTAVLLRKVFPPEQMANLAHLLLDDYASAWQYIDDRTRGPKKFFILGKWCQRGHYTPGIDRLYPAGEASQLPEPDVQRIVSNLSTCALAATAYLKRFTPQHYELVNQLPSDARPFFAFPLFMAVKGVARMHRDSNDLVAFLFLIKSDGDGGELELGYTGKCLRWQVGDAVLLESSKLWHGTRSFIGGDRVVGIFIIHRVVLQLYGLLPPKE